MEPFALGLLISFFVAIIVCLIFVAYMIKKKETTSGAKISAKFKDAFGNWIQKL